LPSSTFTVFYMTEFVQENGQAKKTIWRILMLVNFASRNSPLYVGQFFLLITHQCRTWKMFFLTQCWDSPILKLCHLNLWLPILKWKAILAGKIVIVEQLGESQPWIRENLKRRSSAPCILL
jgi:hypothetical protein